MNDRKIASSRSSLSQVVSLVFVICDSDTDAAALAAPGGVAATACAAGSAVVAVM